MPARNVRNARRASFRPDEAHGMDREGRSWGSRSRNAQLWDARLIETLGKQLKGDVRLTYEPGGFVYALDMPLASVAS